MVSEDRDVHSMRRSGSAYLLGGARLGNLSGVHLVRPAESVGSLLPILQQVQVQRFQQTKLPPSHHHQNGSGKHSLNGLPKGLNVCVWDIAHPCQAAGVTLGLALSLIAQE